MIELLLDEIDLTLEKNIGSIFANCHKNKNACIVYVFLGFNKENKALFLLCPSIDIDVYNMVLNCDTGSLIYVIKHYLNNRSIFISSDVSIFKNVEDIDSISFMYDIAYVGKIDRQFVDLILRNYKD